MNNEETKVLNQSEETVVMNDATENKENVTETASPKKKSVVNEKVAYAAGGFAAGLASGVAGSAYAASPSKVEVKEEEVVAITTEAEETPVVTEEPMPTQAAAAAEPIQPAPDPEDVLVATDEGIRIAQVDDNASFAEAFADARAQVGPGGAFEWRGHVYNTYYEEEWNNMSASERAEYQQKIDYEAIAGNTVDSTPTVTEQHTMASDTEMVDEQSGDEGVRVLGIEAVVDAEGNQMTVAVVESGDEQALLVDVDNDGMMDVIMVDENGDCQVDMNEIYDISEAQITTDDLMQNMAATQDTDMYMASNDGMPDYMNDADVSAMV